MCSDLMSSFNLLFLFLSQKPQLCANLGVHPSREHPLPSLHISLCVRIPMDHIAHCLFPPLRCGFPPFCALLNAPHSPNRQNVSLLAGAPLVTFVSTDSGKETLLDHTATLILTHPHPPYQHCQHYPNPRTQSQRSAHVALTSHVAFFV